MLYLLTYSYVLLFKYKSSRSFSLMEAFMYMWQLSFLTETIDLVLEVPVVSHRARARDMITRLSMKLDVLAVFMSLIAFGLRW